MKARITLSELLTLLGPHQCVRIRDNQKLDKLYEGSIKDLDDEKPFNRYAKLVCADGIWLEVIVY